MDRVRMEHPKLPGRHIMMRPGGVKARERAGWHVVQPKTSRRRRTTNTEEEKHDFADTAD